MASLFLDLRVVDGADKVIKRSEPDFSAAPVEECVVLGMGVVVADQQVEDDGLQQFSQINNGVVCSKAQQGKTVFEGRGRLRPDT